MISEVKKDEEIKTDKNFSLDKVKFASTSSNRSNRRATQTLKKNVQNFEFLLLGEEKVGKETFLMSANKGNYFSSSDQMGSLRTTIR